jgi:hypothetical protein
MMKIKHFPVFLLIIPAGLVVVFLMLLLTLHLETIVSVVNSWFFGKDSRNSGLLFYLAAAMIPLLCGGFMCLAALIISRADDKKYEREWKAARRSDVMDQSEFMESVDSIDTSIVRLKDVSARMREQTRRLSSFCCGTSREEAEPCKENPSSRTAVDTLSVTMENSEVSGLQIIYPVQFSGKDINSREDSSPQEPFPPHGSHQKIWYFPNI